MVLIGGGLLLGLVKGLWLGMIRGFHNMALSGFPYAKAKLPDPGPKGYRNYVEIHTMVIRVCSGKLQNHTQSYS